METRFKVILWKPAGNPIVWGQMRVTTVSASESGDTRPLGIHENMLLGSPARWPKKLLNKFPYRIICLIFTGKEGNEDEGGDEGGRTDGRDRKVKKKGSVIYPRLVFAASSLSS